MHCNGKKALYRQTEAKYVQDEHLRYVIDWIHGYCDMPCVDLLFEELEKIDERFARSNFVKWSSGFKNYKNRYCLNSKGSFFIAYNDYKYTTDEDGQLICGKDGLPESEGLWSPPDDWGYPSEWHNPRRHTVSTMVNGVGGNKGVFISISGDGCRYIGNENFMAVLQLLSKFRFRCSRLDVACDLLDERYDIYRSLVDKALYNKWTRVGHQKSDYYPRSNMHVNHLKYWDNLDILRHSEPHVSRNWSWGHYGSAFCEFRMYDKWLETHQVNRLKAVADELCSDCVDNYWWRFEYSLHQEGALNGFNYLVAKPSKDDGMIHSWSVAELFSATAARCFEIRDGRDVINLSELDTTLLWLEFLQLAGEYVRTFHFV